MKPDYGYVSAKGEHGFINELKGRLSAYCEAKELMMSCKSLILYIALKNICKEIKEC
jgi:hypothetical protein